MDPISSVNAATTVPAAMTRMAVVPPGLSRLVSSLGITLGLIVTSSISAPAQESLKRFSFTQYHMGIDARIVVYTPDRAAAERACEAAFARIGALDTIMSDYRRDSELMRLCDRSGGPEVKVSKELFTVLDRAVEVSDRSEGAFDVSVGPLITLWRKARKSAKLPSPAELESARRLVDWKSIHLNRARGAVRLAKAGMRLDLGGIAKGYAADEAQVVLKRHGVTRALVELGGDIVVTGAPPAAQGWKIRVPNAGDEAGPADLFFTDRAISTSGDTEQFVVIEGRRYSHVVDPRTGQALTNRAQVTLTAPDGLTSDPLSTALSIVGRERRSEILKGYSGVEAFVRVLPLLPPAP